MKVRLTIEKVADDNKTVLGPKTAIAINLPEDAPIPHLAYFHAVLEGLTALVKHEGIRYANYERAVALESIDEAAADEGDTDNE